MTILDVLQIVSGKGNPLAKAAARGEAGEERSMQQAVAYDLDILQRLAVTETTLSGTLTACCTHPNITRNARLVHLQSRQCFSCALVLI